eukprot:scaffold208_cov137-Skeletonema_menzelii.AAC.8
MIKATTSHLLIPLAATADLMVMMVMVCALGHGDGRFGRRPTNLERIYTQHDVIVFPTTIPTWRPSPISQLPPIHHPSPTRGAYPISKYAPLSPTDPRSTIEVSLTKTADSE